MRARLATALVAVCLFSSEIHAAEPVTWPIDEIDQGQSEIAHLGDRLVHTQSQYSFPLLLGDMPARKTTTFGEGDASVDYSLYGGSEGDAWIDVYVYPAHGQLSEEVDGTEEAILTRLDGERIDQPDAILPASPAVVGRWYRGKYGDLNAITGLMLSKVGSWYIKARVTIPLHGRTDAMERAGKALREIDFQPSNLSQPSGPVDGLKAA